MPRVRAVGEVGGRGGEHARAVGDRADAEVRVLEGAEDEGHVERLGGDVDAAVGEAQADVDLGVEVVEGGDQRRDQALADAEGGGDVQRAARAASRRRRRRPRPRRWCRGCAAAPL